jgi:thiol-disulfide isomerase/thioredoxin
LALIGVAAALYVMPGCSSNPGASLRPLAVGAMKKLVVADDPEPAPDVVFTDAQGRTHTLADFKGKVVVVNLWATWCAPCVAEMPTLAKLAEESGGQPVVVAPISLDTVEDRANAMAFIAKRPPLRFYAEPKFALAFALKPPVEGLPTTLLIDRKGLVRARLAGGADWSSPQAQKVIQALKASS